MNIDDMKVGDLKELINALRPAIIRSSGGVEVVDNPWELGKIYLIRTVTMIDTGRLVRVTPQELVLEDAAWIADTGRFAQALDKAEFGEVEPFPSGEVIIGRGSIIDAVQIKLAPRSQK